MKAKTILLESSGYIGASFILVAYFLVSFNILSSQSVIFQYLNLIGSVGNITYYIYKKAYSGAILDSIWLVIAIFAIGRLLLSI